MPSTKGKIRVLIIDDHAGLRSGIRLLLAAQPDMEVVGEAIDGREACAMFRGLLPDITLVDLNLPFISGLEVITTLLAEYPRARFVVITGANDGDYLQRVIAAGARAYLDKDLLRRELLSVIREVYELGHYAPRPSDQRLDSST